MAHSRHVDNNDILITTISSVVTLKELIELQNELYNYRRNDTIYELVIYTDEIEMVPDSNESIIYANIVRKTLKGLKKGAIAFVSNNDFIFGILRQLQMRVANEYIQLCVFRNEEMALKWLQEMKLLSKDELSDNKAKLSA